MSLASLCNVETVTIERQSVTVGDALGAAPTFATGNRPTGAPTTKVKCRLRILSAREQEEYAIRGQRVDYRAYFATDPQLNTRDRLITAGAGDSLELYVMSVRNPDRAGMYYYADCKEGKGMQV